MRATLAVTLALALAAFAARAASQEKPVFFALTEKVFWLERPRDALQQAQLVANKMGADLDRTITVKETQDQDTGALADALEADRYQFVISDGLDMMRLQEELNRRAARSGTAPLRLKAIVGVCMPPEADSQNLGTTRALIVTRNDPQIRTMADLKGKRLVYGPLSERDCSMLFLEGLLRKEGAKSKEEFFSSVKRFSCEDACLIALRRGSADVTCISEEKLLAKAMVAGNFTVDLKQLESSKPYLAYTCFYLEGRVEPKLADDICSELLALHQTPEGLKLLDMFHVRRFAPVPLGSLAPIEDLIRAAQAAPARTARHEEAKDEASGIGG